MHHVVEVITSDLMFVMEEDEEGYPKFLTWVCGITTATIEDIVEYCTILRDKGEYEAFGFWCMRGMN